MMDAEIFAADNNGITSAENVISDRVTMGTENRKQTVIYGVEDRPPLGQSLLLSLQVSTMA